MITCGITYSIVRIKCITFILCCCCLDGLGVAAENATIADVQDLFEYCTKQIPNEYTITALVLIEDKPWDDKQVAKALSLQEEAMATRDRLGNAGSRVGLRKAREQAIREAHSGKQWSLLREYCSGEQYRLDRTNFYSRSPDLSTLMDSTLNDVHVNVANGSSEAALGISQFKILHSNKSAWASMTPKAKWTREDLWQIRAIEPQYAFVVVSILMDKSTLTDFKQRNIINGSFAGVQADSERIGRLISGSDEAWNFTRSNTSVDGVPAISLVLSGKNGKEAAGTVITYTFDAETRKNLLLYQAKSSAGLLVNVRRSDYRDGMPYSWVTDSRGADGSFLRKTVTVLEYKNTLPGLSESIFGFNYPTNYTVEKISADGKSEFIQNPTGAIMAVLGTENPIRQKKTLWMLLFFVILFASPVMYAMRRARDR